MLTTTLTSRCRLALLALFASPLTAWAQPVLITSPATVGPMDVTIVDQLSGLPVPLATADITVRGTTLTMNGRHTIASLVVEANGQTAGVVTHSNAFSFDYAGDGSDVVNGLDLMVNGEVLVEADSSIDVSGRGFGSDEGPGTVPGAGCCGVANGGGGHGGRGGNGGNRPGGETYGSMMTPTTLGSGGGSSAVAGGSGGGAIQLSVSGVLLVDGEIKSNGTNGQEDRSCERSGGGAGGSIWIQAGSLAGTGLVSASGGDGILTGCNGGSGGGGGGRIAIYTCDQQLPLSNIAVNGGTGFQSGHPGTIYFGSGTIEITKQPMGAMLLQGEAFDLSAAGMTTQPDQQLSYQWRKKDETGAFQPLIEGQGNGRYTGVNTPMLSVVNATCSDSGQYDCLVMDSCGSFPTIAAQVTVESPADFNNDGVLNFFDVSAFLAAFSAQEPDGDFNGDGLFNFFDVSAFLSAFSAGCP